jgi:hypothetical protein
VDEPVAASEPGLHPQETGDVPRVTGLVPRTAVASVASAEVVEDVAEAGSPPDPAADGDGDGSPTARTEIVYDPVPDL